MIDDELLDHIVSEINKYAAKVCEEKRRKGKMKRKSRDLLWRDTNKGEMYAFLGLLLLQGIVKHSFKYITMHYNNSNMNNVNKYFKLCIQFCGRDYI